MSSAYEKALKKLKKNQKLFQKQVRPEGVPQEMIADSAFNHITPEQTSPWYNSNGYNEAMKPFVAVDSEGYPLAQAQAGGGNKLRRPVLDDVYDAPFTDADNAIMSAATPTAPAAKAPARQVAPAQAPVQAPQAQAPAPNPYSMNPFASNFSPSAFRDGLGSQRSDVQYIPGAAAYEGQRGYIPQQQQKADAAKLMDPRVSKTLDLF